MSLLPDAASGDHCCLKFDQILKTLEKSENKEQTSKRYESCQKFSDAATSEKSSVNLGELLKTLDPPEEKEKTSNRLNLYKKKHVVPPQEERRRQFLQSLKDRRDDFVLHARNIAFDEDEDEDEPMDSCTSRNSYRQRRGNKPRKELRNQLMLSEWLVQLPQDLESEWILVPCPVGKRSLVVASRGCTKVYSRTGHLLSKFSSLLPGGSNSGDRSTYSILDCLFCKDEHIIYVLDIMCWKGHTVYDCDTTFRFYWMQDKFSEIPALNSKSAMNCNRFLCLISYPFTINCLQEVLNQPLPFSLDGLLFYHKASPYRQGVNPLVGWLKAFMVPELFPSVTVSDDLCTDKPTDYITLEQYLAKTVQKWRQTDCDQNMMTE